MLMSIRQSSLDIDGKDVAGYFRPNRSSAWVFWKFFNSPEEAREEASVLGYEVVDDYYHQEGR